MKKISIIVPIYNNDKYLSECIESIITQDYSNLEILLINDGSTDQSGDICDEYQIRDNRIKVFHQKNSGVSAARNLGLEKATGDYITFIDSDDWIDQGMYTYIVNKLKENIDLVYTPIKNRENHCANRAYAKGEIRNKFILPFIGHLNGRGSTIASVCSLLISRKILDNLKFEPISMAEDKIFFLEILLKTNSLLFIKSFYNYRQNPTSTLNTYNPNFSVDITYANNKVREILEKRNLYTPEIATRHNNTILRNFYEVIKNEAKRKGAIPKRQLNIEVYNSINNIDKLLTWKKTLMFSKRNLKWILVKLKKYNFLLKQLEK